MTVTDPDALNPGQLYETLIRAADTAHPLLRNLKTSHWEMGLDWYLALRRASLPPELPDDDEARDESKWKPDPADTVLGYCITVIPGAGGPRLAGESS